MLASKKFLIVEQKPGASSVLANRLRGMGGVVMLPVDNLEEAAELAVRELPSVAVVELGFLIAQETAAAVRGRFAMPVVFTAASVVAAQAAGLEPAEFVLQQADERELHLVFSGVFARVLQDNRLRELESRLKEEQAFADLGRVTGKVAHQFNNLLMAISSGVALVRMDVPEGGPIAEQLNRIDNAVEKAADLSRQLLAGVRREQDALSGNGSSLESMLRSVSGDTGKKSVAVGGAGGGIHGAVLIVDDDESVRALARWVVERAGYAAVTARDGDEALERFRADPGAYGLVLLDLTMPRMSGEEVMVGLRAVRPNVQIVVITGYGEDVVRESDRAGITGFVQKPFSPDALRAMLKRCADGVLN